MTPSEWTTIVVALIGAGLLKYAANGIAYLMRRRKQSRSAAMQTEAITTVDQSLAVVARARDELEADNALLRAMLAEERAAHASERSDLIQRHAVERIRWDEEKAAMRAEIADLERRLREMLVEVESLRLRAAD